MMIEHVDIIINIVVFIAGGGFLWVFNLLLARRKQNVDEFVVMRESWKEEFARLNERIDELEADRDKLKEMYERAWQERNDFKSRVETMGIALDKLAKHKGILDDTDS